MSKFKVGDKVVIVDADSVGEYYKNGDKGTVSSIEHELHGYVTRDDGVQMNVYWTEIDFQQETQMTAEQIRNEILRIDARIEEAKQDIENAQNERNSLVEKLREKGFELTSEAMPYQRPTSGDRVRVVDVSDRYGDGIEVGYEFIVQRDDGSYLPFMDKDYNWFRAEAVIRI